MQSPATYSFVAGASGTWRIDRIVAVTGEGLSGADRLDVQQQDRRATSIVPTWCLRGVVSNTRYSMRSELSGLAERQAGLGRVEATCAALIPIRKSAAWWAMAQDERRAVFEEQSRHIQIGMGYLPAVARRLHHSRDLGEPFDFLTWFEFAPQDQPAFDAMLAELRSTPEWRYVDREVDVRLTRA